MLTTLKLTAKDIEVLNDLANFKLLQMTYQQHVIEASDEPDETKIQKLTELKQEGDSIIDLMNKIPKD